MADPDKTARAILGVPDEGAEDAPPASGEYEVDAEDEALSVAADDLVDALGRKDRAGVKAALRAAFHCMMGEG